MIPSSINGGQIDSVPQRRRHSKVLYAPCRGRLAAAVAEYEKLAIGVALGRVSRRSLYHRL
jgi:hypothetical protein